MSAKKSISLLVVSALLSLPGVARASDIDLQTNGLRVTVGASSGINIESTTGVNTRSHQWHRTIYSRRNLGFPNFPIRNNAQIAKPTQVQNPQLTCNWVRLNQQNYQTSSSDSGVAQTYSSLSTSVCR